MFHIVNSYGLCEGSVRVLTFVIAIKYNILNANLSLFIFLYSEILRLKSLVRLKREGQFLTSLSLQRGSCEDNFSL